MQLTAPSLPLDPTAAVVTPGSPLTGGASAADAGPGLFGALLLSAQTDAAGPSVAADADEETTGESSRSSDVSRSATDAVPADAMAAWLASGGTWSPPPAAPSIGVQGTASESETVEPASTSSADSTAAASSTPASATAETGVTRTATSSRPARFLCAASTISTAMENDSPVTAVADENAGGEETSSTVQTRATATPVPTATLAAAAPSDSAVVQPTSRTFSDAPRTDAPVSVSSSAAVAPADPAEVVFSVDPTTIRPKSNVAAANAGDTTGSSAIGSASTEVSREVTLRSVTVVSTEPLPQETTSPTTSPALSATRSTPLRSDAALPGATALMSDAKATARVQPDSDAIRATAAAATTGTPVQVDAQTVGNASRAVAVPASAGAGAALSPRASSDRADVQAENIAAGEGEGSPASVSRNRGREKNALTSTGDSVKNASDALGTNAAKSTDLMPDSAPMPTSSAAFAVREAAPVSAAETTATGADTPAQMTAAAHRTVETVMTAVDRYADSAKTVKLQFTVSGVDLSVHVAMRGEAIHTTFLTDSAELRTALASQWHAVTGQADDRSQRLADPVFTTAKSETLSADGGGAQSRDSSSRQQEAASTPAFASNFLRAAAARPVSTTVPAAAATTVRPLTNRLLHAFA